MNDLILNDLPANDPHRNTPLIEIGAFYQDSDMKGWREIFPNFGIAKKTFNQLGPVWLMATKWKATKPLWDEKRIDLIGQNGNDGLHY